MKIIFLDFDGVLNSKRYDDERLNVPSLGNIDETRLVLLRELVGRTGAKIVLTTSWRKHWDRDRAARDQIGREINDAFEKNGLSIYDKTPDIGARDRADEIKMWLSEHTAEVTRFVILDDYSGGWCGLEDYVVKTNYRIGRGLEEHHIQRAEELLNQ